MNQGGTMSEKLKLDPKKTALVLIDLQNGTIGRETTPYSASEVIERSRRLADAFRAKNAAVIYVRVLMSDFLSVPADNATILPNDLPPNLSEIAESAGRQHGDLLITKRHWGAFAGTDLEDKLRGRGVETVVLTGIATNMGVESTLRQGTGLGFAFVTVEDACSTFSREMQDFAFSTIFPLLSKVRSTQEVLNAIG
jgi:nicotinamidase-related amidase